MAKLLVVDDEKNLRLVVQKELSRQGHTVEAASDGEEAWELLEAEDFDVVLCDINMPRLDGMGLLPVDAAGKIDVKASGGTCTVTLYTYGYVI